MRGLIDMATHSCVEKLLYTNLNNAPKSPRRYNRFLSLGALLEELTENGGGLVISVLSLMREEPSDAAYTSLAITVIRFLIETGRMLGKIHKVYNEKPCSTFRGFLVWIYRELQWPCTGLFCCRCCKRSIEDDLTCCLCAGSWDKDSDAHGIKIGQELSAFEDTKAVE